MMEYTINLDHEVLVNVQALKILPFLTDIYFEVTVDAHLQQKVLRISKLVEFLSEHPTIRTRLKVLSIEKNPMKQYKVVTVGGTFDRLHIGHQILLLYAALSATETIHLGITADLLLSHKKYNKVIQNMLVRMHNAVEFMRSINSTIELVAYQLNDDFGTTTTQERIQSVIFSPQPGDNLIEINIQRVKNCFAELQVVRCPLLTPIQKYNEKFSSTYIRKELLDKNQMTYEELSYYREKYDSLIEKLTKMKGQTTINKKSSQLWWDFIYFSYSQRWRFYHTNRHIYQLFKFWNSQLFAKQREKLTLTQMVTLQLVLFFHNVVYRPGNANNQKESADVCQKFIEQYLGDQQLSCTLIGEVKRLIRYTQSHSKPECFLSQIIYDLDMGILNDPIQYKVYAQYIRKEYGPLVGQQFRKQRVEFLSKTLKEGLHFSFAAEYAQANMKWEMQTLQYCRN